MTTNDDTLVATRPEPTIGELGIRIDRVQLNQFNVILPALARPAVVTPAIGKKVAPKALPPVAAPAPVPAPAAPAEELKPEFTYDADGTVRYTTYKDKSGAKIVLREDPKDRNNVRLELTDEHGTITTYGDRRGFEAIIDGKPQKANNWHWPAPDTLTCPSGTKLTNDNETESVTRDKLQQFAGAHPQLAGVLRKVNLPVTVMGGYPVKFIEAMDTASEFRACPVNNPNIVLERLTEKSASLK